MLCWVLSAGSILGFVLVAVRDVLRRQGVWKGRPREHEVAALVCCRCLLKAEMVSGVYAGVFLCM